MDTRDVEILECSLRDGSYAVDFNFTAADTGLLVRELSKVGFKWIEVGHGMGIGADLAGKGEMPQGYLELIKVARKNTSSKIGMFYIPSIVPVEHLLAASREGLDFVRIGANATEAAGAFDTVAYAKKLGLTVGMNLMKSYAISPVEFGRLAKEAEDAGADIVYLVDSVGGMNPREVEEYIGEATSRASCEFGFHGHDNLKMAVANTLKAFECGAKFLDSTMMGVGRGAGNAPSEALVCLLEDMGVDTGVNIYSLLKMADVYITPLLSSIDMYDTKEVAMGYGKFHSSHMPKVMAASQKYQADLKELIIRMGRIDPVNIDEHTLEEVAKSLEGSLSFYESKALTSYPGLNAIPNTISLKQDVVSELIKGMAVTCGKRRKAIPVLELNLVQSDQSELILAEHLWDSERIVVGRITSGNENYFIELCKQLTDSPFYFIINPEVSNFSLSAADSLRNILGLSRFYSLDTEIIKKQYISNWISKLGNNPEIKNILIYGDDEFLKNHLLKFSSFEHIIVVDPDAERFEGIVSLSSLDDWGALNMEIDLVYTAILPGHNEERKLNNCLSEQGKLLSPFEVHNGNSRYTYINLNSSYETLREQMISYHLPLFLK